MSNLFRGQNGSSMHVKCAVVSEWCEVKYVWWLSTCVIVGLNYFLYFLSVEVDTLLSFHSPVNSLLGRSC